MFKEVIQTATDTSDSILVAGKKLADTLRSRKAFTNTSTFDLKCEVGLHMFELEITKLTFYISGLRARLERGERSPSTCRTDRACKVWRILNRTLLETKSFVYYMYEDYISSIKDLQFPTSMDSDLTLRRFRSGFHTKGGV